MAKYKVTNVNEVLSEGDTNVWVKVIGIDEGKVSLSMKLVDQVGQQFPHVYVCARCTCDHTFVLNSDAQRITFSHRPLHLISFA